jgi:hypothetical protein
VSKRSYTTREIDEALSVAWQLDSPTRAAEKLGIPKRTLAHWVNETHKERYEEIAENLRASVDRDLVDGFHRNARRAIDVASIALERTEELLNSGQDKDANYAAGALRNIATTYGIAVDKGRVIEGKPTEVVEGTRGS